MSSGFKVFQISATLTGSNILDFMDIKKYLCILRR